MAYNYEYPYTDPNKYNDDWLINQVVSLIGQWEALKGDWQNEQEEFDALKKYIDDYFANLDLQDEVNIKLEAMSKDGTLSALIKSIYGANLSPLFANSLSDMTDVTRSYVLTSSGEIYYYANGAWTNSHLIYGAVNSISFLYRGQVSGTSFADNIEVGFYNYSATQSGVLSDWPLGLVDGGVLLVYKPAAASARIQIIETVNGLRYIRIGNNPFTAVADRWLAQANNYLYRGPVDSSFTSCTLSGYYGFSQASLSEISDKPDNLTYGGVLRVETQVATNARFQTICDSQSNVWFRVGGNPFTKISISDAQNFYYRGPLTGSLLSTNSLLGFYSFTQADVSNFTDMPAISNGGALINIKPVAGTAIMQLVFTTVGDGFMRIGGGGTWMPIFNNKSSGIGWYALGDSITRGYGSVDGHISGPFVNNWVSLVAKKHHYTLTNYGEGGMGYNHASTELNQIDAAGLVDTIDFSQCDMVTLAFGINDWHYNVNIGDVADSVQSPTTCGKMKYCITKILADNPYCKIFVVLPFNCSKYGGTLETRWALEHSLSLSGTLQSVIDKIESIAKDFGIEVVNGLDTIINIINIETVLPDGIHPSQQCHIDIARDFQKRLNYRL